MSNEEQTPPAPAEQPAPTEPPTEPDRQPPAAVPAWPRDRSGSQSTRSIWMATGVSFFGIGLVFTLTMPDNFALGITFLGLGVVFFSLAGSKRAPGDGPGAQPEPQRDAEATPDSDSDARPPA